MNYHFSFRLCFAGQAPNQKQELLRPLQHGMIDCYT